MTDCMKLKIILIIIIICDSDTNHRVIDSFYTSVWNKFKSDNLKKYLIDLYIYIGKTGNKSDSMKMNKNEKTQGLERMILLIELFANVKCFNFLDLHLDIWAMMSQSKKN